LPRLDPIIAHNTRVVAYYADRVVYREDYVAHVAAVVSRLPDTAYVINLCDDRYHFQVGLTAAMEKKHINLLLPTRIPEFINRIHRQYPDLYVLADAPCAFAGIPVLQIQQLMVEGATDVAPLLAYPPDQVLAIAFTSGSTGDPKPNVKTWECLVEVAAMTGSRFQLPEYGQGGIVATVPPQHMYGLETSVMLPMQFGWGSYAGRPFFPQDVADALAAVPAPRVLITTPVHIRALTAEAPVLPKIEYIISATAPLSAQLAQQAEAAFDTRVYEIFGFTEVGSAATRRTVDEQTWHLFDKIRLRRDGQSHVLDTPYIKNSLPVSDIIEAIDEQRFSLLGRDTDMVNIAGKRASLGDLNARLLALPGVVDGVFFNPDDKDEKVRRLAAFVVAPQMTVDNIIDALRDMLDPAFMPRPVVLLDKLPRNATGKLPRSALLELVERYVVTKGKKS